jgi:hypothetical protein
MCATANHETARSGNRDNGTSTLAIFKERRAVVRHDNWGCGKRGHELSLETVAKQLIACSGHANRHSCEGLAYLIARRLKQFYQGSSHLIDTVNSQVGCTTTPLSNQTRRIVCRHRSGDRRAATSVYA